jgi:RHS repeat-associated protein
MAEVARFDYDAFGRTLQAVGTGVASIPFRFSTKYTDPETSLLYYGYRFYNPSTGRWLSRDPIGERGGANLYGFVNNNPIYWVDPLGLKYAELYAGYGAVGGGGVVAIGSIAVDAVTLGVNILATPAEIAGGITIGGAIGYVIGSAVDRMTGNTSAVYGPVSVSMSRESGKERATDSPSWAKPFRRNPNEKCGDFAERLLNEKYGCGSWNRGPGSEYSQIKKWCERSGLM